MKPFETRLLASTLLVLAGCMSGSTKKTIATAERDASDATAAREVSAPGEPAPASTAIDERALGEPVDRATMERAALARHPGLVEAAHRVRALAARARAEGSLPSPEIMAELQAVPLRRPYAIDEAGMLALRVQQQIPPPGALDRMAEATGEEARVAAVAVAVRARALIREVDRAFADYVEATSRHTAHVSHAGLVERMESVARARYAAGGMLADVARTDLERARMEVDLAREHAAIEESRARLNGLLARPGDAPLGPPRIGPMQTVRLTATEAAQRAEKSPEVAMADAMKRAATSGAAAADAEDGPMFTVGLAYFHPVGGMEAGWGASFGMSLPWLWGPASQRAESAARTAEAESAAASAARLRVRTEATMALAAVRGAEARIVALAKVAQPAAHRAVETAATGYATGSADLMTWLDGERMALDVELELAMARADLERALADLDGAVGEHVRRVPLAVDATPGETKTEADHGAR